MAAIALAAIAATFAGTSDFLGGIASRRYPAEMILLGVYLISLASCALLLLVLGSPAPAGRYIALGVGGGAIGGVALVFLFSGLAIGPMSVVAPVSATAAVIPVVVGLGTGDPSDPLQLVGMALAISGAVLVSVASDQRSPGKVPLGLVFAVCAAVAIGLALVLIHAASHGNPLWSVAAIRLGGIAPLLLICLIRSTSIPDSGAWIPVTAIALTDTIGIVALTWAYHHGSLSVVSTIASLYPLATVLIAQAILFEQIRRVQWIGIVAAFLGVAMLGTN